MNDLLMLCLVWDNSEFIPRCRCKLHMCCLQKYMDRASGKSFSLAYLHLDQSNYIKCPTLLHQHCTVLHFGSYPYIALLLPHKKIVLGKKRPAGVSILYTSQLTSGWLICNYRHTFTLRQMHQNTITRYSV